MRNLGKYAKHKTPIREEKAKDWHWTAGGAAFVEKYQGEHFDFVSYMNGRYRLKCKKCGAVVERAKSTVRCKSVECEECKKIEKMKADIMPYLRISEELKKTKICAHCGNGFHSQYPTALYCSSECRKKARRKRHPPKKDPCNKIRKRCKKYGVEYKTGISLSQLYNRDNGICQICGKPVNWGDNTWGEHFGPQYPTIDHIVALSNGGAHTWENVQLAHAICNSYKRNLPCSALETMLFPVVEGGEQSA